MVKSRKPRSKKHHYLPRRYLKGFTNRDDKFYVYDKQQDRIFASKPDDAFFENNLNTVTFPDGNSSDFLEDLDEKFESESGVPLDRIRGSTYKTPVKLLDKMHLFFFLLFLYWRLPRNIQFVEKLSERAFVDDSEFDFLTLKDKSGQKAPEEIAEMLRNSSVFKRMLRYVVLSVPFYKDKNWAERLENWRFFYTEDEKRWYVVGDSPIIVRGDAEHDLVNCLREFVFPVSGNILLTSIDRPIGRDLPPEFGLEYDTAIIQQAQRFVACPDRSFLEALVKYYKLYVSHGKTNTIIPEMFEMLEQQDV